MEQGVKIQFRELEIYLATMPEENSKDSNL